MHILEIPSFFTPYGGEFCLEQAKALKALGHEVRILSNVQLGITIGGKDFLVFPSCRFEHEQEGITVYQSYQRGLPLMVHHNVKRWIKIVRAMFADYVNKYGHPDILHAHCAKWAGYAAMLISRDYDIPYVITEHLPKMILEAEFGKNPTSAWQIPMLKEAYQKAQMVLPVSEELVDDIACYFGENYRWQYMSNIVDTAFFHYQQRSSRNGRPFRFCCLADNSHRKGYDVLLNSFGDLLDNGCHVELLVAGRNTERLKHSSLKTYGRLDKYGVRDLLYECDALVLASRSEAQPLVLLEAMSTGIPVIATECVPQNLRIEGGCTIGPIDNAEALADAMKQVMDENNFDGEAVSKKVNNLASPLVIGKKLTELFNGIIS